MITDTNKSEGAGPGKDVVMTYWIALEGTVKIAQEKRQELLERFSPSFLDVALGFDQYLSIPEAATAGKSDVTASHEVTQGGVFKALWDFAEENGVGLEIDLKAIPVKQETIEICNFFDVSPYEMISGGSRIFAADNGYDAVRTLDKSGIHAAVIGKTTEGNDRVVINGDEKRFLTPRVKDEIFKIGGLR